MKTPSPPRFSRVFPVCVPARRVLHLKRKEKSLSRRRCGFVSGKLKLDRLRHRSPGGRRRRRKKRRPSRLRDGKEAGEEECRAVSHDLEGFARLRYALKLRL